jgi:hypothetical protein
LLKSDTFSTPILSVRMPDGHFEQVEKIQQFSVLDTASLLGI